MERKERRKNLQHALDHLHSHLRYAAALGYNVGYCYAFSLPYYLVRVSLAEAFAGSLAVFCFFVFARLVMQNLLGFLPATKWFRPHWSRKTSQLFLVGLLVLAGLIFVSLQDFRKISFVVKGAVIVFCAIYLLSAAALFLERFFIRGRARAMRDAQRRLVINFSRAGRLASHPPVRGVLFLSAVLVGSYLFGFAMAKRETNFTAIEAEKLLIIARFGDSIVCKPYKADNKQILNHRFQIYSLEQMQARTVRSFSISHPPQIQGK